MRAERDACAGRRRAQWKRQMETCRYEGSNVARADFNEVYWPSLNVALQQHRVPMWKLTVTLWWATLEILLDSVDHTHGQRYWLTLCSLHCSCWDWLQKLMGMSVHNNGSVNRAMCGVVTPSPPPPHPTPSFSSCTVYLVSTGWRRWRSASRWPEWQEGRSLFPSSSSAEGYCPPAPAERRREKTWSERVKRLLCKWIRVRNMTRTKGKEILKKNNTCDLRKKKAICKLTEEVEGERITGGINGKLMKGNDEGVSQGRTWGRVAASRLSRRHGSSSGGGAGGGGGRILNEASISGYHPQTNVTDKNGAHDTLVNCMLDNSLATTERSCGVGRMSRSYEQPWGNF